jgi:hypothetical protein
LEVLARQYGACFEQGGVHLGLELRQRFSVGGRWSLICRFCKRRQATKAFAEPRRIAQDVAGLSGLRLIEAFEELLSLAPGSIAS